MTFRSQAQHVGFDAMKRSRVHGARAVVQNAQQTTFFDGFGIIAPVSVRVVCVVCVCVYTFVIQLY